MKKILLLTTSLVVGASFVFVQTNTGIKSGKITHDLEKFSENSLVVSYAFTFTNISGAPLVTHQTVTSRGYTVPEYTKESIQPGKESTVKVTYSGTDRHPGYPKKSTTLCTNAKAEMVRLYIEGDMTPKDEK